MDELIKLYRRGSDCRTRPPWWRGRSFWAIWKIGCRGPVASQLDSVLGGAEPKGPEDLLGGLGGLFDEVWQGSCSTWCSMIPSPTRADGRSMVNQV